MAESAESLRARRHRRRRRKGLTKAAPKPPKPQDAIPAWRLGPLGEGIPPLKIPDPAR